MKELLIELMKNGWRITIEKLGDGYHSYADRGDFNCPHRKQYDPKDGHGLSQIWAEGFDNEFPSSTIEDSINKLHSGCCLVIPGEPYPEKEE